MIHRSSRISVVAILFFTLAGVPGALEQSKTVPAVGILRELVKRSTLTEPGSKAFYLRAKVLDEKHPDWEYTETDAQSSPEKQSADVQALISHSLWGQS